MDNIADIEGAAFVSAREVPWHKLGTVVDHSMTAAEAIELAHLDWEVKSMPVYTLWDGPNGEMKSNQVEGKQAIYRDGDGEPIIFGVLGSRYRPVQNEEAFSFLDDLIDEKDGAHYETAGALGKGERVFLTVKMPETMTIDPGGAADEVQPYILVTNGHDGSSSFQVAVTPIRVVCQNTLTMALRAAQRQWKTSHTNNIESRMKQAQTALGLTTLYLEEMLAEATALVQTPYTEREFTRLVDNLFPVEPEASNIVQNRHEERRAILHHLFRSASTQENIRGTKWGAYNAVGEFLDWERPVRGKDAAQADQLLARDSLFGKPIEIKQQALSMLARS